MPQITLSTHAMERARSRKMELYGIEKLIIHPEKKIDLGKNKFKFLKNIDGRHYQAIATFLPKEDKWLIISVWVRGEEDQVPFIWKLIVSPFKLLWWLLKTLWSLCKSLWKIIAKTA